MKAKEGHGQKVCSHSTVFLPFLENKTKILTVACYRDLNCHLFQVCFSFDGSNEATLEIHYTQTDQQTNQMTSITLLRMHTEGG